MIGRKERNSGNQGVWKWVALGACGIVLAFAIALVAGNLAEQPVGLTGEPVSAGSALAPATSTTTQPAKERRKVQPARNRPKDGQNGKPAKEPTQGGSANPGQYSVPDTESHSDDSSESEGGESSEGSGDD